MKKSVLIVDFDPDSLAEIRGVLDHPIFTLTEASDGEAAQKLLSKKRFDLAIFEVVLPRVHGFALSQWIAEKYAGTKRIIISGLYKGDPYRERALSEAGADDYLEKPLKKSKLREAVSRLLAIDIWEKAAAPPAAKAEAEAETDPGEVKKEEPITIEFDESGAQAEAVEVEQPAGGKKRYEEELSQVVASRPGAKVKDKEHYKKIDAEISKKFEDALQDLGLKK